jgi:peroxiredoxin
VARVGIAVGQAVPRELAEASVLDASGEVRRLGEVWGERDAVVIFVRHFGCAGCAEHVAELRPRLGELEALGVATVLVGNGAPAQLAAFRAREKLDGHELATFTDPTLAAYRAAGLERSLAGTVGPRALGNLAALMSRGYVNGRTRGDLRQQGGTLYVRRGGEVALHHASARVGDHARIAAVVQIALAARAAAVGELA